MRYALEAQVMISSGELVSVVRFTAIGILLVLTGSAIGEIYKYKDSDGNWQFSDKPPDQKGAASYHTAPSAQNGLVADADLKATLVEKFKPGNAIEQASLATVTVESSISSGSGFFITDNGYIITNKHVIRPTETAAIQEIKSDLEVSKKKYENYKRKFEDEEERLNAMRRKLEQYEAEMADAGSRQQRKNTEEKYLRYKKDYEKRQENYYRLKADFDKSRREFDTYRSDFNVKTSISQLANMFKIILKNEEKITAHLVSISNKYDLALLKLDGYQTPALPLSTARTHQAMPVYAVGSPLGIRDSVTSGIVTGVKQDYILTDTKILPGNSGGPLLNEAGQVIGVNTARLSAESQGEGFGLAISIGVVKREFSRYLQ